jgi:hypothetical protein
MPGKEGVWLCRLELGSRLRTGEWTSDGGWQEVLELPLKLPSDLPQIPHSSLKKVTACFYAYWSPLLQ